MYIIKYNANASIALTASIVLVGFMVVAATVGSVINKTSEELNEEDIKQMVDDSVKEISTYIQIKDIVGVFEPYHREKVLKRIVLLITPLYEINLDLQDLIVQLQSRDSMLSLHYQYRTNNSATGNIFKNSFWTDHPDTEYSCMTVIDKDNSVNNYHTLNSPSDMIYITIQLSKDLYLSKGEQLFISLIPSIGILRTIQIEAPIPIRSIVRL